VSPSTITETTEFLGQNPDDSRVLAGGQSLMPLLNMRLSRPEFVVDLGGVEGLTGIEQQGQMLRIGAMTTQYELGQSAEVAAASPLLAECVPWIGHIPIRYRGTVGGSVAHADPAAELPAAMVALDGEIDIAGSSGTRTIAAAEFYRGFLRTAMEPGEVLTALRVPIEEAGVGVSVKEYARRHGDFAVTGIVAVVRAANDRIQSARLTAFGVDSVPVRLEAAEAIFANAKPSDALHAEAGKLAAGAVEPDSDLHASADYRRRLTDVLTRRASLEAATRATQTNQRGQIG